MNSRVLVCLLAAVLFVTAATIYGMMFYLNYITDIRYHVWDAETALRNSHFPPHFLYFATLTLIARCTSTTDSAFCAIATAVLAVAVASKYAASVGMARQTAPAENPPKSTPTATKLELGILIGLFLLSFAHALPRTPVYYRIAGLPSPETLWSYFIFAGRTTGNVYHNSTTVFLMPFAVLLFHQTYLLLQGEKISTIYLVALVALNVAAKPSFVIVMAVVLPPLVFTHRGVGCAFWKALGAAILGAALIFVQTLWFFCGTSGGGVTIAFMRVWGQVAPVWPLDILASLAYPIIFCSLFPRAAYTTLLFRYAASLMVVATLIGMFLSETTGWSAGNFMWQTHICTYLLFLGTFLCHGNVLRLRQTLVWRDWVLFVCLGLHALSGIGYIAKIFVCKTCS